ncbi:MAG TPA: Ig-like domain-containing protein [bacterium]|nr:Ig-like domain-containing protein [bacterium]HNS34427.1 Ig-like domain-containing protein [bacterium]HNW09409.1 Ig-like domain-containing protein [bacterium]HPW39412.1 Ig-like domain-containing protein [bacterium]
MKKKPLSKSTKKKPQSVLTRNIVTAKGTAVLVLFAVLAALLIQTFAFQQSDRFFFAAVAGQGEVNKSFLLSEKNKEFLNLKNRYDKAPLAKKNELISALVLKANERREKLLEIAKGDPALAYVYALDEKTKANLPVEVRGLVETKGSWQGKMDVYAIDDFEANRADVENYLIDEKNGRKYRVYLPKNRQVFSGDSVVVKGVEIGAELVAGSIDVLNLPVAEAVSLTERKVLVIVSNFNNAAAVWPVSTMQSVMFGEINSVNAVYKQASNNQLAFKPDTNGDGKNDIAGPFTLNFSTTDPCDYYVWANEAKAAATAAGYDLSLYQHILHIMPRTSSCNFSGVANLGCTSQCQAWVIYPDTGIATHELGHNLGMRHATLDANFDGIPENEYGDDSDFMGLAWGGLRLNNAAFKHRMGWLDYVPDKVVTINSSGTYKISALEADPLTVPFPQIIKIAIPNSDYHYYLSFRGNIGYDSLFYTSRLEYGSGVAIHRTIPANLSTLLYPWDLNNTLYHMTLKNGGIFSDPASGLTVTQLSFDPLLPNPYVEIKVDLAPQPCVRANPVVSVSPASLQLELGGSASAQISIKDTSSSSCQPATYSLSAQLPTGFSQTPSEMNLTLSPGETQTYYLTLTAGQEIGSFSIIEKVTNIAETQYSSAVQMTATVSAIEVDSKLPSVIISKPRNNSTVPKKGDLSISAKASDESGIKTIEILFDGSSVYTCNAASCKYALPVANISAGNHTITVIATDASPAQNKNSASVTVVKK